MWRTNSQLGTPLLGFLALTWTRTTLRESRRERVLRSLGMPGNSRDSPSRTSPPEPAEADPALEPRPGAAGSSSGQASPAQGPEVKRSAASLGQSSPSRGFRGPFPVFSPPGSLRSPGLSGRSSSDFVESGVAASAPERIQAVQALRTRQREALRTRAAPTAADSRSMFLGALLAGPKQGRGVAPPTLPTAAAAVTQPGPETPFRLDGTGAPALPLERGAQAAPKAPRSRGVPDYLRQQAAVSLQPGGSPWFPAWTESEPSAVALGAPVAGPDPTQPLGPRFGPDPVSPAQPPILTGSTTPAPGLGPALHRSMITLEALRDQLAQILREDALRHGLNLKE